MANGDTKTNQYLDIAAHGTRADFPASCCETRSQTLIREVGERIMDVEDEVERLENNPDVVDIVATYADLQDYDTSGLTDKDIIRVLEDSTHEGNSTYYRWNATTNQFDFVGEIAGGTEYTAGDGIDITNDIISATNTGKAKVLTTDDYNWPTTGTKTSVALWLLDAGLYCIPTDAPVSVQYGAGLGGNSNAKDQMFLVGPTRTSSFKKDVLELDNQSSIRFIRYSYADGRGYVVHLDSPVDNLNSNDSIYALSAKQGKVLKSLIDSIAIRGAGAPTTSTVGEVGQLYEDGTNGALYQLKSIDITVTPNTYNWEEVGAGAGGGVIELTTADYNYPETGTKTAIALWLLPQGEYVMGENVVIQRGTAYSATLNKGDYLWVQERSSGGTNTVSYTNGSWVFSTATDTGYSDGPYTSLSSRDISQSTGTSTSSAMSQNAVTSMVYASSNINMVRIGSSASTESNHSIAIGSQAVLPSGAQGSIALGAYSGGNVNGRGTIDVGSSSTSYGYGGNSNYRLLTGLYDGQSAHDAVNVSQVNSVIDAINTALSTNIPHIGA